MRSVAWLLVFPLLAGSQTPRPRVVRASAEAVVTAKPDRARIDIGVVTEAPAAEEAAAKNAEQSAAVIAKYKPLVGAAGTLQTVNYSLAPNYSYQPNESPKIRGYRASNTVEVTMDDVSKVGKVIDAAAQAGSNQIQSIRFELKDDSELRRKALEMAAKRARANAEAIAAALGVRVIGLAEAESGVAAPQPVRMMAAPMAMMKADTPVQEGEIEVQATVTVALEVEK
jgi:uncharacterized protein YggE